MKGHIVKNLSVADLKAHLSEALREVEAGGRIVVERRGRPVAVIVAPDDAQGGAEEWWRELDGIMAGVDDFEEVMRDVVRSRRDARPRPVHIED